MDLNVIMNSLANFFATDFGRGVKGFLQVLWELISPSNAPGAHDVPLAEPKKPECSIRPLQRRGLFRLIPPVIRNQFIAVASAMKSQDNGGRTEVLLGRTQSR